MSIHYYNGTSSTSSGDIYYLSGGTCTACSLVYRLPPPRVILVKLPECWLSETTMSFIRLVNEEANTGWNITMLIEGDVLIVDPNIETRTLKEFVPLLRWHAVTRDDRAQIDLFFEDHPIEDPVEKEVTDA